MIFGKKPENAEHKQTYAYEVFPDNIPDGEYEFDGIKVSFAKPGWQWIIQKCIDDRCVGLYAYGGEGGYPTRDAALVDLLKAAKELNNSLARVNG